MSSDGRRRPPKLGDFFIVDAAEDAADDDLVPAEDAHLATSHDLRADAVDEAAKLMNAFGGKKGAAVGGGKLKPVKHHASDDSKPEETEVERARKAAASAQRARIEAERSPLDKAAEELRKRSVYRQRRT
jgi:hypothetical protein